ncbi:hypothetical protein FS837_004815 [Tulasnella sp. UAMH 9824]|nr:hypothetical protein FS837_004815 [Tulasnella sp. UAMH 9824]
MENSTDEHPSSRAVNLRSENDMQNHGDDQRGKYGGADERKAGGNNDSSKGEASKDNILEQELDNQPSILRIGHEITSPKDTINEGPGSGDRNTHLNGDIENPDVNLGEDEGTGSRIINGDRHQKQEEAGNNPGSTNEEQNGYGQTSKPKVGDGESEFLAELSHPNIVTLEGFVEELSQQKVWLVFPWEEHGNLRDFLASGEWEIPERISLIWDVTVGLEYLHKQEPPIYHGDLKSLNILVDSECHALITDFGSARRLEYGHINKQPGGNQDPDKPRAATTDHNTVEEHITLEAFFSATASTITLTGSSYTLRWAAPELLQDDKPCLQSDVWALGWIAYEVQTNLSITRH